MKRQEREKRKSGKNIRKGILFLAAFAVEAAVLAYALVRLTVALAGYRRGEQAYAALTASAVTDSRLADSGTEDHELALEAGTREAEMPKPEGTDLPLAVPEEETASEVPIQVDWKKLRKTNKEIIGWLYCADTPINYPVVQTKDNEYYLTHDAAKKENECGALFLDRRNSLSGKRDNLIIYGHRMNDNSMFGTLHRFARKTYYQEHPVLYFLTPDQNYRFEILGCRTIHAENKYYQTGFSSDEEYEDYITSIRYQSYYATDVSASDGARIATLSTCTKYGGIKDPRIQLCGVLVPIL